MSNRKSKSQAPHKSPEPKRETQKVAADPHPETGGSATKSPAAEEAHTVATGPQPGTPVHKAPSHKHEPIAPTATPGEWGKRIIKGAAILQPGGGSGPSPPVKKD